MITTTIIATNKLKKESTQIHLLKLIRLAITKADLEYYSLKQKKNSNKGWLINMSSIYAQT